MEQPEKEKIINEQSAPNPPAGTTNLVSNEQGQDLPRLAPGKELKYALKDSRGISMPSSAENEREEDEDEDEDEELARALELSEMLLKSPPRTDSDKPLNLNSILLEITQIQSLMDKPDKLDELLPTLVMSKLSIAECEKLFEDTSLNINLILQQIAKGITDIAGKILANLKAHAESLIIAKQEIASRSYGNLDSLKKAVNLIARTRKELSLALTVIEIPFISKVILRQHDFQHLPTHFKILQEGLKAQQDHYNNTLLWLASSTSLQQEPLLNSPFDDVPQSSPFDDGWPDVHQNQVDEEEKQLRLAIKLSMLDMEGSKNPADSKESKESRKPQEIVDSYLLSWLDLCSQAEEYKKSVISPKKLKELHSQLIEKDHEYETALQRLNSEQQEYYRRNVQRPIREFMNFISMLIAPKIIEFKQIEREYELAMKAGRDSTNPILQLEAVRVKLESLINSIRAFPMGEEYITSKGIGQTLEKVKAELAGYNANSLATSVSPAGMVSTQSSASTSSSNPYPSSSGSSPQSSSSFWQSMAMSASSDSSTMSTAHASTPLEQEKNSKDPMHHSRIT